MVLRHAGDQRVVGHRAAVPSCGGAQHRKDPEVRMKLEGIERWVVDHPLQYVTLMVVVGTTVGALMYAGIAAVVVLTLRYMGVL